MAMNIQKEAKTYSLSRSRDGLARKMFAATLTAALLLTVLFWSNTLWAADKKPRINEDPVVQQQAADFIRSLADEALTSLKQKGTSLADQEKRFNEILREGFDVNYIGRISLGRHRKKATRENLEKYYTLFPEYLVKIYTSRLTKLHTKTVKVGRVFPNGKRDMYVRTKIINGEDKTYDVDWRVRPGKKTDGHPRPYKIIDVKIEGISMARTQRDDFTSRISTSGMNGLIDFMQSIVSGTIKVADRGKSDREKKKPLH